MRPMTQADDHPAAIRLPAGLVGALAVCLAIEAIVARHDADLFTTVGAAAWAHASESARRLTTRGEPAGVGAGVGVLGFGDSLVKHGVLPAVLRQRLGRPSWNLAMPWGQAFGHDILLRRLLRDGARPDALVIDGELLGEDPALRTRIWPELLRLSECVELAWATRDARLLGELVLARLIPSLRARADIRAFVWAMRTRAVPPDVLAVPVHRLNWRRNHGAEPLPIPVSPPAFDAMPGDWTARRDDWSCHPVNAVFIERFLARAGSRGIPVFWLLPPTHPGVQRLRQRNGRDAAIEAFARGLAGRHPNLTVLDARRAGYPPAAMFDATHLNRDGAAAFSASVADAIAEHLREGVPPPSRWVVLPDWDPATPARVQGMIALEDVEESAKAFARR